MAVFTKGFSLVELSVALGLSSIVALGTSSVLVKSMQSAEDAKIQADSSSLANEIRNELQNAFVRRQQVLGVDSYDGTVTSAASKQNCSGTFFLTDTTSTMLTDLLDPNNFEGTKARIVLRNAGSKILDLSSDANRTRSGMGKSVRILDLKLRKGLIISSNSTSDTISADLFVTVGTKSELDAGQDSREIFITRMMFTRNRTTGVPTDCNVPLTQADPFLNCSIRGHTYNSFIRACTYFMNSTSPGVTITHCPVGQHLINQGTSSPACVYDTSSADCIDDPTQAAKGFLEGRFNCVVMGALVPMDSLAALPPPVSYSGASSDCISLKVAYDECVANAASVGFSPAICSPPPLQNCTKVTNVSTTATLSATTGTYANPWPVGCKCGASSVPVNGYCGSCSYNLFRGYGYHTNEYSVDQCVSANSHLTPIVGHTKQPLTNSNFPVGATEAYKIGVCTGVRRPVSGGPPYVF